MTNYFVRKNVMVVIIFIRWSMRIIWWWWWYMPTHLCCWWKGKHYAGWSLTLICPFDLSLGINLEGRKIFFFIAWWCVLCCHFLWLLDVQDTTGFISMTSHSIQENVREHAQIDMLITTSTDGESLSVPVSNKIKQFSLWSKLVGITSDFRTYLVICKAILESNFDITGVFESVKPMFVIKCLSHVLDK